MAKVNDHDLNSLVNRDGLIGDLACDLFDLRMEHSTLRIRLREAARKIQSLSYLDDDVLNRHQFTTTSCEALRELFALAKATDMLPTPSPNEA